jgi:GNAT superfamily N-acetyltransferase
MTQRGLVIEEVRHLDAVWPEVESLLAGLSDYSAELMGLARVPTWRELLRERAPSGPESLTLLGRTDGQAVGLLSCVIVRNHLQYDQTFAYVETGFVLEQHRRSGITRALLERAEAWSLTDGVNQMRTTIHGANAMGVEAWSGIGFRMSSYNMTKWLEAPP